MDIASVGASGAYIPSSPSIQSGRPQATQETQQLERQQQRPPQAVEPTEDAPRPVTNVEGQRTGTMINVQA